MEPTFSDLIFDRSLSFVTRWHQKPSNGEPESMAEHSGWVARLAMYIAEEWQCATAADWFRDHGSAAINWKLLFELALIHDDPEQHTGDIPGSFKYLVEGVKATTTKWEVEVVPMLYNELHPRARDRLQTTLLHYVQGDYADRLEAQIVKLADRLSALAYANAQVHIGNRLMNPIRRTICQETLDVLDHIPWWHEFEEHSQHASQLRSTILTLYNGADPLLTKFL